MLKNKNENYLIPLGQPLGGPETLSLSMLLQFPHPPSCVCAPCVCGDRLFNGLIDLLRWPWEWQVQATIWVPPRHHSSVLLCVCLLESFACNVTTVFPRRVTFGIKTSNLCVYKINTSSWYSFLVSYSNNTNVFAIDLFFKVKILP